MTTLEWRLYEAGYCTHPELATRRGASAKACQFPALVALLRHPVEGLVLFDTGYSEPVSYTHLDVYKRQSTVCCRSSLAGTRWWASNA